MLLAASPDGEILRAKPGAQGFVCPGCLDPVIPKCGEQVIWHFAHERDGTGCDLWAENEGSWHLGWKLAAADAGCRLEVTMRRGPEWHRADIVRPDGVVVEVQHSPLGEGEALDRESFYRRCSGGLVWLWDATGRWWDQLEWTGSGTAVWPGYSETVVALEAPMFWDTPQGVARVEVTGKGRGAAYLELAWPIDPEELFRPDRSSITPIAQEVLLVPAKEVWRLTAVRCWSCGARPTSTFPDGSPLYECHKKSPAPHAPSAMAAAYIRANVLDKSA